MTGSPTHSLLQRQLKRFFPENEPFTGSCAAFIAAVNAAYAAFDDDRAMLERSLELSSQELLQANSEMRALFQAIPDLLFRVDAQGQILSAKVGTGDDPLLAKESANPGELLQATVLRAISGRFMEVLRLVLDGKKVRTLEFGLEHDRERLVYEVRLIPVLERDALVIVRNITEQKKAEETLWHTVSLLQSTFESTAEGMLVVDLNGRIVSYNRRFAKMWRIPPQMLEAKDAQAMREFSQAQLKDPEVFRVRAQQLYADATAESSDVLEFKDGRVFERYSCPQSREGVPIGRVWSFRDITERKQTEEALRAEEERFRLVALATRDAIYDWNLCTGSVWRNEAYQSIYSNLLPADLDSLWWEEHIHPDDCQRIKQSFADALLARERMWTQEYRFLRADGSYATLMDRGYIVYDGNLQPVRMIGAMTDISERKRLEEQFLQSQKMEAIGQLAGGVAHDFNNLLTVIQGNFSLLRIGGFTKAEQASTIDEGLRASQRAATLTRQLLTFSRREPIELKTLELNEVVAEMTRMFQRLVGEHIMIQTTYAPGGMPVLADSGMLEQLLMNLVVNSRDAMPKGGRLHLQTADMTFDERSALGHTQRRPGRFVHLRVTDTGTGISAKHLPHIFEPFYTTKEAGKGTGLGLATVFGIVQQHGGWIEVESKIGEGTSFNVYLPRLANAGKPAQAVALEAPLRGGNESILIAEDEDMVRRMMKDMLERHGYRVYTAESGAAAIEFSKRFSGNLDLLITDMVMPGGITGIEVGEILKAARPRLKVIHCSGYTDEFLGENAPRRDSLNFLNKPFDTGRLLRRVRDLLDGRTEPPRSGGSRESSPTSMG